MLQVPSSAPGANPTEEISFTKVWSRVMPQDRPDCPLVPTPQPRETPAPLASPAPWPDKESVPAQAPQTSAPITSERSMLPVPTKSPQHVHTQDVMENDVPYLGASSAIYGSMLQAYIDQELSDWRTYLALSRRCPAGGNRILAALAADERRHSKRLSVAYFLISGIHYWPVERISTPIPGAWPAALRRCFCAEQKGASAYLAAAAETSDPALRALYTELAADEASHAQILRELLEQM